MSIDSLNKTCNCYPVPPTHTRSLFSRIRDGYIETIQNISQSLFKNNWVISHLLVGSLLGEPCAAHLSGIRRLFGWKASWEKHGFFDASDPSSLKKLETTLKAELVAAQKIHGPSYSYKPVPPVLLLHSLQATPAIWMPWNSELQKARDLKQIGHLITLQLPNEMQARQNLVRQTIEKISQVYRRALKLSDESPAPQLDLIGHSRGGYSAHLAAFKTEVVYDQSKIQRRWHCIDERNPLVRKVVSLAAPTWLCCMNQTDEKHPTNNDIYPLSGFSQKQIETIHAHHRDIYDIIASEDTISVTSSPLPENQVKIVKHGHLGLTNCLDVCRLALSLLQQS